VTDLRRPEGGYRGALPPRGDMLARPWVIVVFAIFVLIFALAFAGFPSRLLTEPTPLPSPSVLPSAGASGSLEPSVSGDPSASP
jgi:hypothetical protein